MGRPADLPGGCPAGQRSRRVKAAQARSFDRHPANWKARIPALGEASRPQPEGHRGPRGSAGAAEAYRADGYARQLAGRHGHAHGQRVNADGPHRDDGRPRQPLSGPLPSGSFAIRAERKDRARQHSANGRSHAKRSRHIPELLQSKGARAEERPVRQGLIVSVLLARLRAPTRPSQGTARISRSTHSLDTSTTCWPFTPSDGWTRLSPSRR